MPQLIKLKRSAVPGKKPTTTQLELGEVSINTNDGTMFIKKDDGINESIVMVTAPNGRDEQTDLEINYGKACVKATIDDDATVSFVGFPVGEESAIILELIASNDPILTWPVGTKFADNGNSPTINNGETHMMIRCDVDGVFTIYVIGVGVA